MSRRAFLSGMIGTEWQQRGFCWGLAQHVERELFDRELADMVAPSNWLSLVNAVQGRAWRAVAPGGQGEVVAPDGALVLMARTANPVHVGVWLKPEGGILHALGRRVGVNGGAIMISTAVFETPMQLHMGGWMRRLFYEPVSETV